MTFAKALLVVHAFLVVSLGAAVDAQTAPALSGTWNMSLVGDHVVPVALVLEQHDADLSGTVTLMGKQIPVRGQLTGRAFSLTSTVPLTMQQHTPTGAASATQSTLSLKGSVKDDGTLEGEFAAPNGAMKWTAERLRQRPSAAQPTASATAITGQWSMVMAMQPEPQTAMLDLTQLGKDVTGTLTNEHLGTLTVKGTIVNGRLDFSVDGDAHGMAVHIAYIGAVKADGSLSGDLSSPVGNATWSATRVRK